MDADLTVEELFKAGQERRICLPQSTAWSNCPGNGSSRTEHFVEVSHPAAGTLSHLGPPYRFQDDWWQITRPAPLLGEHNRKS